jgi:hypothetical protein
MVNGRYDATFPLEGSQEPLFRMLGAPPRTNATSSWIRRTMSVCVQAI